MKESFAEAHQPPEAAGSEEAVKEKEAMEKELLQKVPSTDEARLSLLLRLAAATSETAPAPTEASSAVADSAPGQSNTAAAAVADGAGEDGNIEAPKPTTSTEKTEADNTEYAPPACKRDCSWRLPWRCGGPVGWMRRSNAI